MGKVEDEVGSGYVESVGELRFSSIRGGEEEVFADGAVEEGVALRNVGEVVESGERRGFS